MRARERESERERERERERARESERPSERKSEREKRERERKRATESEREREREREREELSKGEYIWSTHHYTSGDSLGAHIYLTAAPTREDKHLDPTQTHTHKPLAV